MRQRHLLPEARPAEKQDATLSRVCLVRRAAFEITTAPPAIRFCGTHTRPSTPTTRLPPTRLDKKDKKKKGQAVGCHGPTAPGYKMGSRHRSGRRLTQGYRYMWYLVVHRREQPDALTLFEGPGPSG